MFDNVPIRYRTKLALVAGGSVVIGLAASLAVALYAAGRLGDESSAIISSGLTRATEESLGRTADETAQKASLLFGQAANDVKIVATALQTMIDDGPSPGESPARSPSLRPPEYRPADGALTSPEGGACNVSVWKYLVGEGGTLSPEVRAELDLATRAALIMASVQGGGTRKVQTYFVGSDARPITALCPWTDLLGVFRKLYPGGESANFWTFFFPGIVENWKTWPARGLPAQPLDAQLTYTAPYDDAAGGGAIITLFLPVWSADRKAFAAATAVDLSLQDLAGYVAGVHLGESGFAFLAQQNGNVLAVNERGARILQLKSDQRNAGLTMLERPLSGSAAPGVARLALPSDDAVRFEEIEIDGEAYLVALRRLAPFAHVWTGSADVKPETWSVGLVLPKREIFATLAAAQGAIKHRTDGIITAQIAIAGITLAVVLLGIVLLAGRLTRAVGELADRAGRIMQNDYDVEVSVSSRDEMAQLGTAFNAMVSQIRKHTSELEQRVAERTAQLKSANDEILTLNEKLKAENTRMGAELDVARRVQLMVLPPPRELAEIGELDVVGHMQPATEVGGDYYDVAAAPGAPGKVVFGIGDVTGHGLESGVLMLMIQTAVRTMLAADERDVARILAVVNKVLYHNVQRINSDHSASLSLLVYHEGQLTLTGQHEEALVVRAGGEVERVSTMELGFPVGIEYDITPFLAHAQVAVAAGDVVVLFTDGITEAENPAKEQYGVERLCEIVRAHRAARAAEIKTAVLADITAFIGEQQVFDDLTLVVAKRA